jgi:hypothetical protein
MANYSFETHLHRYAVWTAARAVQRNFTTTKNIQFAIEASSLKAFLEKPIVVPNAFEDWHRETANLLISKLGGDEKCSYGRAAKIISIYLKTSVGIRFSLDHPVQVLLHPPIDRILLQNLGSEPRFEGLEGLKKESWTKLKEDPYWDLVELISSRVGYFDWRLEEFWKPGD